MNGPLAAFIRDVLKKYPPGRFIFHHNESVLCTSVKLYKAGDLYLHLCDVNIGWQVRFFVIPSHNGSYRLNSIGLDDLRRCKALVFLFYSAFRI